MDKISISASKIKLAFEDCYGKYYYKYVLKEKIEEVVWPGTILGEIIHKFIENSINAINNNISLNDYKKTINFEKIFFQYLEEYKKINKVFKWNKGISKKEFLNKGQKYSELFVRFIYGFVESEKQEGAILIPEYKLEIEDDEKIISGIIDLFIKKENSKVIDFKTTKDWHKWFYIDWLNDIQSLMYLKLIFEKLQIKINSYDYLILDHDKKVLFFKDYIYQPDEIEEKIKLLDRIINKLITLHRSGENTKYFMPEKTKCFFCDFKDICKNKII